MRDWFGPRITGFGIEPKTWEGMALAGALLLFLLAASALLRSGLS